MYGFEAVNNSGSVLISDSHQHLAFKERFQLTITNSVIDRPSTAAASFSSPVRTQAPPDIFARVLESRHASVSLYCVLLGGPGNWTGVRLYVAASGAAPAPRYVIDLVVCHFVSAPVDSGFGMTIYDANGVPVFSDKDRLVRFSKFTKKWTYSKTQNFYDFHNFTPDVSVAGDEYVDITSINRGAIMQYAGYMMYSSLTLLRNSAPTLILTAQSLGNMPVTIQGVAQINFCMAICKFPLSDYPA